MDPVSTNFGAEKQHKGNEEIQLKNWDVKLIKI